MVVSNIVYFHPYLGKIPILTHIFQRGWFNHQLDLVSVYLDAGSVTRRGSRWLSYALTPIEKSGNVFRNLLAADWWTGMDRVQNTRLESLQECVFSMLWSFVVTKHASIGIHGHRPIAVYGSDGFTLGLIHDPRFVEVRKFGDGTLRPLWKKTEASNEGHLVHSWSERRDPMFGRFEGLSVSV